jgi:hypothetical protein
MVSLLPSLTLSLSLPFSALWNRLLSWSCMAIKENVWRQRTRLSDIHQKSSWKQSAFFHVKTFITKEVITQFGLGGWHSKCWVLPGLCDHTVLTNKGWHISSAVVLFLEHSHFWGAWMVLGAWPQKKKCPFVCCALVRWAICIGNDTHYVKDGMSVEHAQKGTFYHWV